MDLRHCLMLHSLLLALAVPCLAADGAQACKAGPECFPGGIVPDEVSPTKKPHFYYCCPEKNTTFKPTNTSDGTYGCSCVPDYTLDERIQKWADDTKHYGRMCLWGKAECAGVKGKGTTNYKYVNCCWPYGIKSTISVDADKEEYIGCRCKVPTPTPNATAYIVPQTSGYNTTGEDCFYDEGCEDRPAVKCTSPDATFCCYGSRGIVTENDARDSLTKCTCTNQVYGGKCERRPVPLANTELPCLTECGDKDDDDMCRDKEGSERCCLHNMAVSATLYNGSFIGCTCTTGWEKSCTETLSDTTSSLQQSTALLLVIMAFAILFGQFGLA